MKRTLFFILLIVFYMNANAQNIRSDSIEIIHTQNLTSVKPYVELVGKPGIEAGVYSLKKGDTDQQQPHELDEVYIVMEGVSEFMANDEIMQVTKGDVIFVRASVPHKFINISTALKLMVWFSGSRATDHNLDWKLWSGAEIRPALKTGENTFLDIPTMTVRLYMLPQSSDDDPEYIHEVNTIHYVAKGEATFKVNDTEVCVAPGTLLWIKKGAGYYFQKLSEDLEIFVLFEKNH